MFPSVVHSYHSIPIIVLMMCGDHSILLNAQRKLRSAAESEVDLELIILRTARSFSLRANSKALFAGLEIRRFDLC